MLKTHKLLSGQRVKSYEKTIHKENGDSYLGKGSNISNIKYHNIMCIYNKLLFIFHNIFHQWTWDHDS